MNLYHTTDADGISLMNPDRDAMQAVLLSLDDAEIDSAEHPDVSLVHDATGWTLTVFPSGIVTFENLEDDDGAPQYLAQVSRDEALQLWLALAEGNIAAVQSRPWQQDL